LVMGMVTGATVAAAPDAGEGAAWVSKVGLR
jgi:hypothetical protein